jgi:hypothetical protein
MSRASTPIVSSQPQMNAIPRRKPAGMLSKTIMVTTEPGLVNATANPKPATSGISVPIALPPLGRRQPFAVYDTIFSAWTRRAQLDFTRTG